MYCQFCGKEMIWSSDFDTSDFGVEEEGIVSFYYCPHCDYLVQVFDLADNIMTLFHKNQEDILE